MQLDMTKTWVHSIKNEDVKEQAEVMNKTRRIV